MDSEELAATRDALRILARRDLTPSELKAKLTATHSEQVIVIVLSKLETQGFLSERRAIDSLLYRLSDRKAVGDARLKQKLSEMGCPHELIEEVIQNKLPDETDRAQSLIRAKFKTPTDPAKIGRFLYSRGFEESTIESVLENLSWAEPE